IYTLKNKDFVGREYEEFVNTCKNAGIEWMNETRFSVEEYQKLYQNNIERAVLDNFASGKKVVLETKPKKYADENPLALTDGVFGGGSFYSDWLGFEGNDFIAVIDLNESMDVQQISINFLQVVNHIVFLPLKVTYYYSNDAKNFFKLGSIINPKPLTEKSKINDTQNFEINFNKVNARYIKVHAENMKTPPAWHHGTGLPSWIFADEIIVN
ncbi:MAG: discoidin domain-containing protein, partial [Bacteroidales bacterium]|nr:discoidin domain-containing protein [Bacteroidales bacterium]